MLVTKTGLATAFLGLFAGCSSSPSNTNMSSKANPCATPGATYLEQFVQESGNCGALSEQIVNVNADGTITLPVSVSCAQMTQEGCTAHNSDCTDMVNGVTCTGTSDVTFAANGSTANGLETLTCSSSTTSCTSTYGVTATRQ